MYLVGIDIAKYKHNCFIATETGVTVKEFVFDNNNQGFKVLLTVLTSLDHSKEIRIGLESTGHYANNLEQFLIASSYTYIEFNPYLVRKFSEAQSLRRTKTDKVDAKTISSMLGSVDYKTLHTRFYHTSELKSLVRYRDTILEERSKTLVKLTNLLDFSFPEFKPFFNNRYGVTAFYILKRYKSKERIAKLTMNDFELLKSKSKGKFTYPKFSKLKSLAKESVGNSNKTLDSLTQTTIRHYEFLRNEIVILDQNIISIFNKVDSKLTTIPGLGLIQAATIYSEIGNIHNFNSPSQLTAYAGLDVSVYQSGISEHHGKIIKRGSPLLRKAIYTYALPSIRFIPVLHDYYHKKKSMGKHHKVCLVHVCRKLIRIIHHIETNNISFNNSLLK